MKSAFAKGLPIFGMQRDEVAKGMRWLKAKMRVNKIDLKAKVLPLMITYTPK